MLIVAILPVAHLPDMPRTARRRTPTKAPAHNYCVSPGKASRKPAVFDHVTRLVERSAATVWHAFALAFEGLVECLQRHGQNKPMVLLCRAADGSLSRFPEFGDMSNYLHGATRVFINSHQRAHDYKPDVCAKLLRQCISSFARACQSSGNLDRGLCQEAKAHTLATDDSLVWFHQNVLQLIKPFHVCRSVSDVLNNLFLSTEDSERIAEELENILRALKLLYAGCIRHCAP